MDSYLTGHNGKISRVRYGDEWLKFDDFKVNRIEAMEWNSRSAYLIFLRHVVK